MPIEDSGFVLTDTLYKKLKWAVQVVMPAISTLYFTLGSVWDWSYVEPVLGTMAAVTTFGGVLLGVSTRTYNKSDAKFAGEIKITEVDGVKKYNLVVNGDPENIDSMDEAIFKIA